MRRFHQSDAKVLLAECPAALKHRMDHGQEATRAMKGGSLFDYLVFQLDRKYEIVDADSWRTKDAKESRASAEATGRLAVLQSDVDKMMPQALKARASMALDDTVLAIIFQPHINWTSPLGTECAGTPDTLILRETASGVSVQVVDLKRTASLHPTFLQRQVYAMCWDVQAAAYREAALEYAAGWALENLDEEPQVVLYSGHTLLACEAAGIGMVQARRLSEQYLEIGQVRWEKAQRIYLECVSKGEWPEYPADSIHPSPYVTRLELGDDESGLEDVGLDFGE